jgi:hypothetical protein
MFDEEIIMYVKVNTNNVIHRVLYRTEKIKKKFFQSINDITVVIITFNGAICLYVGRVPFGTITYFRSL